MSHLCREQPCWWNPYLLSQTTRIERLVKFLFYTLTFLMWGKQRSSLFLDLGSCSCHICDHFNRRPWHMCAAHQITVLGESPVGQHEVTGKMWNSVTVPSPPSTAECLSRTCLGSRPVWFVAGHNVAEEAINAAHPPSLAQHQQKSKCLADFFFYVYL